MNDKAAGICKAVGIIRAESVKLVLQSNRMYNSCSNDSGLCVVVNWLCCVKFGMSEVLQNVNGGFFKQ